MGKYSDPEHFVYHSRLVCTPIMMATLCRHPALILTSQIRNSSTKDQECRGPGTRNNEANNQNYTRFGTGDNRDSSPHFTALISFV